MSRKHPELHPSFLVALRALLMRVTQDATVIRNLIHDGFDVQARNLLRSADEHVNTIYYLCLRPEVSGEFISAEDEESANQFWHRHIKRSRKFIYDTISRRVQSKLELAELKEFRDAEWKSLSTAHHPSHMAATIPFLIPYESVNVFDYMFGLPSEQSYRTGKLLFYILSEMPLYLGFLNDNLRGIISRAGRGTLQKIVRQGCLHLTAMRLQLVQNWNCPLFASSPEMVRLLKRIGKNRK
jgi:hypothetical protein